MNNFIDYPLVDVIALSNIKCSAPIEGKLAYATAENFVGRVIDGYCLKAQEICLMTEKSASALCVVQNDLLKQQIGIFIYDAYRPLRAVKDFVRWFHEPVTENIERQRKKIHYPDLEKTDLARLGYLAESVSRHNFGHVVDLVLIDITTKLFLDMGTCFDFFGEISHATATENQIGIEAYRNRRLLTDTMQRYGFIPHAKEFWHFEYKDQDVAEPLDIPIVAELKNLNISK